MELVIKNRCIKDLGKNLRTGPRKGKSRASLIVVQQKQSQEELLPTGQPGHDLFEGRAIRPTLGLFLEQKLLPPAHGKAAHRSQPSCATSGQGDGDGAHLAGGHRAHLGGRTVPGRGRYSSTWECHSFAER